MENSYTTKHNTLNQPVVIDGPAYTETHPHIPTGSFVLDYLIGGRPTKDGVIPCPGWPKAKITHIYGEEGVGKTTLALTACASVASSGGSAAYFDFNCGVDPQYAAALGVPVTDSDRFLLFQPDYLDKYAQCIFDCAKRGVDLIVVDSLTSASLQKSADHPFVNNHFWSDFLPRLSCVIAKSGTALIGISPIRADLCDQNGTGYRVPGGMAWNFQSSLRILLEKVCGNRRFPDPNVHRVKARLDKCRVSDSYYHEQDFYLRSGAGIDDLRSLIDVAVRYGVIERVGSWYTWDAPNDGGVRMQGMSKLYDAIRATDNGVETLSQQVIPLLGVRHWTEASEGGG